jgi:hypothetical protein
LPFSTHQPSSRTEWGQANWMVLTRMTLHWLSVVSKLSSIKMAILIHVFHQNSHISNVESVPGTSVHPLHCHFDASKWPFHWWDATISVVKVIEMAILVHQNAHWYTLQTRN